MVGRFDDVQSHQPLTVGLHHREQRGGSLGGNQLLAGEILDARDRAVGPHQQARARDEVGNGESHLLAPFGIVGG